MRVIELIYDVARRRLLGDNGLLAPSSSYPEITLGEHVVFNVLLVWNAIDVPYEGLDGTEVYTAAADNDYDGATDLWAKSLSDQVNLPGDWLGGDSTGGSGAGGGTAWPEAGELSWRMRFDTASLEDELGTTARLSGKVEFQARTAGGVLLWAFEFPMVARNLIDKSGAMPVSGASFAAAAQALPSGVSTVTVTGLSMASTPVALVVSVRKPLSGDLNLTATVRAGSITTAGFIADLNGITDKTGYQLDYIIYS